MKNGRIKGAWTGFSRWDMAAGTACVGLLIAICIPALGMSRQMMRRANCAANVRDIIQAMYIYAQSNQSVFPATPGPISGRYCNCPQPPANGGGLPGTRKKITEDWYGNGAVPGGRDLGNPLACLWLLVINGQNRPSDFICPSDPLAARPSLMLKKGDPRSADYFPNFGVVGRRDQFNTAGKGESYSIAYPWKPANGQSPASTGPWWTINDGADVPVLSDMAPLDMKAAGAFNRDTTAIPPVPPSTPGIVVARTRYRASGRNAPPQVAWTKSLYNSGNHRGAGQNVGFADIHVSWEVTPYCGQFNDNIFTYVTARLRGKGIGGRLGAMHITQAGMRDTGPRARAPKFLGSHPPFDTCMVPVRNVKTGAW